MNWRNAGKNSPSKPIEQLMKRYFILAGLSLVLVLAGNAFGGDTTFHFAGRADHSENSRAADQG
jgi:hypothetical protein